MPNFDLLSHLQTLDTAGAAGEWQVGLPDTTIEGRVCALRKSEEAIQQGRRRIERRASKKQTTTKPKTWEYARYVTVFTMDDSTLAETIMEWYRLSNG